MSANLRPVAGCSRRTFLTGLAGVGLAGRPGLARAHSGRAGGRRARFTHGVASGDPLADRVILWTRALGRGGAPMRVEWVVARDPGLRRVVSRGRAWALPANDWTVKVDAAGLAPGRTYYYGFAARGARSAVGRTRTTPAGHVSAARLAVATCADYSRGLYNAYARIAERDDIDAVIHLGDYIYEGGRQDRVRPHVPPVELRTLADYRGRYASYRTDPALASMHARHPVIWVWDDHETVDGTWREGADPSNHDPVEDGPFADRKAAALQAALEWMPIRSPDARQPERIYRRFAFGSLIDLFMLDTRRIGRDRQAEGDVGGDLFRQTGEFADPTRQLLGAEQERWLIDGLRASRAAWRLIGNQVVFAQIKAVGAPEASGESIYVNPDQWDGYKPARDRIFDALEQTDDVVILTGDVHASLAFEVTRDPNNPLSYDPATGDGALAVEFVAPSISSLGDPAPGEIEIPDAISLPNPHLKYLEATRNGYLLLDVNHTRVRSEYWLVPTVTRESSEQERAQVFRVRRGRAGLKDRATLQVRTQ